MIYFLTLGLAVYFANYSLSIRGRFENAFTAAPFIILILFAGFRVDAGYDYGSYVQVLENGFYLALFEPVSILYGLLANLAETTQLFFIATAATLGISLFLFLKKEPSRHIFIALYFSSPFCFIDSFSVVRQYLAASFFLAAYSIYSKHRFFAVIFSILGILSHKTALMAGLLLLALVIVNKFTVRCLRYLDIFSVLIPLIVALAVFFVVPYTHMFEEYATTSQIGYKGAAFWLVITLPFIFGIKRYSKYYSDPIAVIAFVGLGIYAGLALYGYFVSRFFVFFAPFAALFLSRAFRLFLGKKALLVALLISIINTAVLLNGASNNPEFDFLNNYKFYPSECMNCDIRKEADF